jgi:aryl-alcohol dehydrogenase-like predicted oxidoreductase
VNSLSRIALGTAQFGFPYGVANKLGQVTQAEAKTILEFAAANGIDTLDTAIAYGDSESYLGKIGTKEFKVITKLPSVPESCMNVNRWLTQQFHESLGRLGLSQVYGLLLHHSGQLSNENGGSIYRTLQEFKMKGLVQKIGISIYSPFELEAVIPAYSLDLVQAPFNMLDQRLLNSGWLNRMKDLNVEVHTRSTFLQGLLLMPEDAIPKKFSPWKKVWQTWHSWLEVHDVKAVHAALAFPLSFPQIDRVIIGVDSFSQLKQITSFANLNSYTHLPNLQCDDLNLIIPANWSQL